METKQRTIVKALVWALIGVISMSVVGFVVTGSWGASGSMAFINTVVGLTSYVIYERIWSGVRWGRTLK